MHLALVINSLGIGGAERVLVRLAHIWAERGHQISFITFFQENDFCYQLNTKDKLFDYMKKLYFCDNLQFVR